MSPEVRLSDSNREALIIRWRRLLILGLIDFFNGSNEFGKLIVKELIDMYEGLIKAFAESLDIPLFDGNNPSRWRGFQQIFSDILNNQNLSDDFKNKLREINSRFSSAEFNSLRRLRNDETHYLNLPDIPRETVMRVWRLFYDAVYLIDAQIFEYSKNRSELRDFYYLQDFFRKVVLDGDMEYIDLSKLKRKRDNYPYIRIDRKFKVAEIEMERDVWELVSLIRTGKYLAV